MINLLPEKNKKELLMERNRRVVLILCYLVLFFAVSLGIIFLIIQVYLSQQINVNQNILAKGEEQFSQSAVQEAQSKIKTANTSFRNLNVFYGSKIYYTEVLEKISGVLLEGFYLTNLSIKLNVKESKKSMDDGSVKIEVERKVMGTLSGFAPLREDLLIFKEKLENEEGFSEIFFPSSNWVNKEDINFYLTFEIVI